jgi:zinc/manganese transport system substrate-binding protein
MTTVLPITLLTRAVAGDCARVEPLFPSTADPHDLQARPTELARLARARVLVRNGLGLDDFLLPLIRNAARADLQVIDASRGVTPLPQEEGHGHDHDHGHAHGGEEGVNPHVWLDPLRARQQVEAIRDGLIAADPSCRSGYQQRAQAFSSQLTALNGKLERQLAPVRGRTLITFHDLLPYFAARYGLQRTVLVELPGQSPSVAALEQAGRIARQEGLKGLLAEPGQNNRALQALSRDLNLPILPFDPLERGEENSEPAAARYLRTMEANGAAVAAAAGAPADR